jgi:Beta-lactamase
MTSTCFPPAQHPDHVPADLLARRSVGYATLSGFHFPLPRIYPGGYPAGSALTTPSDHARFLLAMAGGGRLGGEEILRRATAEQMFAPQAAFGPDPAAAVGLIWNVFKHGSEEYYVGHGGEYMWGWNSVSRCWPDKRIAVTASTNQWDLGDMGTSERPSHLAGRLMLGIVTAWVNGKDPRPRRGPTAARSYFAGLLVADRLISRLGSTMPLTDAEIAGIADTAIVTPGTPWDPESFRSALRDLSATDGTLPGLLGLVRREMPQHHYALLERQLGVPYLSKTMAGFVGG